MINRTGYACINMGLKKKGIKINRKMILKTFKERGPEYAGELALLNIQGVVETLKWNVANNMLAYRMSSAMFPWMSEYEFKDLPQYEEISNLLSEVGQYAKSNDVRLSFHLVHLQSYVLLRILLSRKQSRNLISTVKSWI